MLPISLKLVGNILKLPFLVVIDFEAEEISSLKYLLPEIWRDFYQSLRSMVTMKSWKLFIVWAYSGLFLSLISLPNSPSKLKFLLRNLSRVSYLSTKSFILLESASNLRWYFEMLLWMSIKSGTVKSPVKRPFIPLSKNSSTVYIDS